MPSLQDNADRGHKLWHAPMAADRLPLFARRYMDARPLKFGARSLRQAKNKERRKLPPSGLESNLSN